MLTPATSLPSTVILIGQIDSCSRLSQQLELLECPPVVLGWVLVHGTETRSTPRATGAPILGTLDELEAVIARRTPAAALVCLPAVMRDLIQSVRTRLRKLGVADRYMPTLEDQLLGVGPRMQVDLDLAALIDRPARAIDERLVRSIIEGKRVLITGAGGSIGSELARLTADFAPSRLILVDRAENGLFEIDRQIARRHPQLPREAVLHDVVDRAGTLAHFTRLKPHIIFHAAAHKHVPMMEDHPAAAVDNNLFGTQAAADAADAVHAERFVMISTDKAVRPTSIMGATKRLAELYVQECSRQSDTQFAIVRFGNVLGSSGSVLDIWSRQIADGGPITITDPRMTRFFMTIPEAAALVMQAAALSEGTRGLSDQGTNGSADVYVLDMGEPIPIVEMAQRFVAQHGLTARMCEAATHDSPLRRPSRGTGLGVIDIVVTGRRPGEKLHEELVSDGEEIRPTAHPRISIWMIPAQDSRYIERLLATLSPGRRPNNPAALADLVRGMLEMKTETVAA